MFTFGESAPSEGRRRTGPGRVHLPRRRGGRAGSSHLRRAGPPLPRTRGDDAIARPGRRPRPAAVPARPRVRNGPPRVLLRRRGRRPRLSAAPEPLARPPPGPHRGRPGGGGADDLLGRPRRRGPGGSTAGPAGTPPAA